jgi:hypothetical protein
MPPFDFAKPRVLRNVKIRLKRQPSQLVVSEAREATLGTSRRYDYSADPAGSAATRWTAPQPRAGGAITRTHTDKSPAHS